MKTEVTLIYHKITVATGLLQNNAYGHEPVLFCLIIPCAHCLLMFFTKSVVAILVLRPSTSVDEIDRVINRSDCNRSMSVLSAEQHLSKKCLSSVELHC